MALRSGTRKLLASARALSWTKTPGNMRLRKNQARQMRHFRKTLGTKTYRAAFKARRRISRGQVTNSPIVRWG